MSLRTIISMMHSQGTGATDADAIAFLTAAGITDPTIVAAIDTFVIDMKAAGLWTLMKALYPLVGGMATTHKFNLKDPRDLDAAFRLTFPSGTSHGANGMTSGSGSVANDAVDTHVNFSTDYSSNDISFGCLNHTAPNGNTTSGWFMGAWDGTRFLYHRRESSASELRTGINGNTRLNTGISLTNFIAANNTGSTGQVYINGAAAGASISTTGLVRPNLNCYLMRLNNSVGGGGSSAFTMKFAFLGVHLTAAEHLSFKNLVLALQSDLGR